jgi:NACHT domain
VEQNDRDQPETPPTPAASGSDASTSFDVNADTSIVGAIASGGGSKAEGNVNIRQVHIRAEKVFFGGDHQNTQSSASVQMAPRHLELQREAAYSTKMSGAPNNVLDQNEGVAGPNQDIDNLVEIAKTLGRTKIETVYGTMRMLRVSQPIRVDDIYVDVNVLRGISKDRSFDELKGKYQNGDGGFERLGLEMVQTHRVSFVAQLEHYGKLMVFGKPGSGKTTLLKSLAVRSANGRQMIAGKQHVPVFIGLRNFAEDVFDGKCSNLAETICSEIVSWGVAPQSAKRILHEGRVLVLLDGLDEVRTAHSGIATKEVRRFCQDHHSSHVVITCRTQGYHHKIDGFADVEIADFTRQQAERFITQWFALEPCGDISEASCTRLMSQLRLMENRKIAELTVTPILLSLVCSAFRATGNIPRDHVDVYETGLKLLLADWDEHKGVQREDPYKNLSVSERERLLSFVAASLFESGDYFPEKRALVGLISTYLGISTSDAGLVLSAIEIQHGLLVQRAEKFFSFSHLTFHEYLAAKWFVDRSDMSTLANHTTEPRWREVLLMAAGMAHSCDSLLLSMSCSVDVLLEGDIHLQAAVNWADSRSRQAVGATYHLAAVRAFYFETALVRNGLINVAFDELDDAFALAALIDDRFGHAENIDRPLHGDMELDMLLIGALYWAEQWFPEFGDGESRDYTWEHNNSVDDKLVQAAKYLADADGELRKTIVELQGELLPYPVGDGPEEGEDVTGWWDSRGRGWTDSLENIIVRHRNIGHHWHLSDSQRDRLVAYHAASILLISCLNVAHHVAPELREDVLRTVLAPKKDMVRTCLNP